MLYQVVQKIGLAFFVLAVLSSTYGCGIQVDPIDGNSNTVDGLAHEVERLALTSSPVQKQLFDVVLGSVRNEDGATLQSQVSAMFADWLEKQDGNCQRFSDDWTKASTSSISTQITVEAGSGLTFECTDDGQRRVTLSIVVSGKNLVVDGVQGDIEGELDIAIELVADIADDLWGNGTVAGNWAVEDTELKLPVTGNVEWLPNCSMEFSLDVDGKAVSFVQPSAECKPVDSNNEAEFPDLVSAIADDPDDLDSIAGADDTLTFVFATDSQDRVDYFVGTFHPNARSSIYLYKFGEWKDPRTYVLTLDDNSFDNAFPSIGDEVGIRYIPDGGDSEVSTNGVRLTGDWGLGQ